jgi:hypothetical protein
MGRWKAVILLLIIVGGCLILGWRWQTWRNRVGIKRQQVNLKDRVSQDLEPKTMEKGIGANWTNFIKCNHPIGGKKVPNCLVEAVYGGETITEPAQITTLDGEVLATMMAGSRVYYLDALGKLQSVIRPKILKFPSGRIFAYGRDEVTEEKASELTKDNQYMETDIPGRIVNIMLSLNAKAYWEGLFGTGMGKLSVTREMGELLIKYGESRKDQLQKFISSGNPSIGILFPMANPGGKSKMVMLPKEIK